MQDLVFEKIVGKYLWVFCVADLKFYQRCGNCSIPLSYCTFAKKVIFSTQCQNEKKMSY